MQENTFKKKKKYLKHDLCPQVEDFQQALSSWARVALLCSTGVNLPQHQQLHVRSLLGTYLTKLPDERTARGEESFSVSMHEELSWFWNPCSKKPFPNQILIQWKRTFPCCHWFPPQKQDLIQLSSKTVKSLLVSRCLSGLLHSSGPLQPGNPNSSSPASQKLFSSN